MSLIHYLLEANLYLVAFYLFYVLLLRNTTLYQLNRMYLLVTTMLAFLLPIMQLGILKPQVIEEPLLITTNVVPVFSATPLPIDPPLTLAKATPIQTPTLADMLVIAYVAVVAIMLIMLLVRVINLIRLSKKGPSLKRGGFTLIEIPGSNVAFSFFGYLFVNAELLSSPTILHHEEVHIRQKHSWDVIYFELLRIINWFNPVVYLLQKSIKEVHEFIADHEVARTEKGASDYADFLISNAYGLTPIQLTNSFFNKNLLKRRIIMLYKKPSGNSARLKYLLTLPLAGGLLCLSTMAFTNKNYALIDLDPAKNVKQLVALADKAIAKTKTAVLTDEAPQTNIEGPVGGRIPANPSVLDASGNKADRQPSFPGGDNAFYKFLKANIDHTKTGTDGAVEDKVMMFFTVSKTGSLYDINVHYPGGDEYTDQTYDELKRVIKLSPKWEPATLNGEIVAARRFVLFNSAKNISLGRSQYIEGYKHFGLLDSAAQAAVMSGARHAATKLQTDTPFKKVELQPLFPGGEKGFSQFLVKNIRYPALAKENNVMGRVFIQFVVEKDGSLTDMKILRDPGAGLGDEAVRVLKLSPNWAPGIQKGQPVRVEYTVPINFSLDTNKVKKPNQITLNPPIPNGQKIFNAVEVQPQFPGGEEGFAKFWVNNIRYPKEAKDANITGRVFLQFIVETDGSLSDIKVIREPGHGLGDEALRALKLSPKWSPGLQNGKPVRVQYVTPINFSLAK